MNTETKPKHTATWIVLLIVTIFFALAIVPAIYISMMSVMLFDAPGSEKNPAVLAFFYTVVSFPILCGVSFTSWIFFLLKLYKTSVVVSLLPLLSLLAGVFQLVFTMP